MSVQTLKNIEIISLKKTSGGGSVPTQSKSVEYDENGTYRVEPDSGYNLSKVTVHVDVEPALQSKTVDSSTVDQTIIPDEGYDGLSDVTVNKYNLGPKHGVNATRGYINLNPADEGLDGYSFVEIYPVRASIDENIQAENIKSGVSILGVTGTYTGSKIPYTQVTLRGTTNQDIPSQIDFTGCTKIPDQYFYTCVNLRSDTVNALLTNGTVSEIGNESFRDCLSLTTVDLSNISALGYQSFWRAYNIQSLDIPGTIATIPDECFSELTNALSSITLHEGLVTIKRYAFYHAGADLHAYQFPPIYIPSTVTTIEDGAFAGLNLSSWQTHTTDIIMQTNIPPTIGSGSFGYGNPGEGTYSPITIYVPDAAVDTYKAATNWSNYADRIHGISERA